MFCAVLQPSEKILQPILARRSGAYAIKSIHIVVYVEGCRLRKAKPYALVAQVVCQHVRPMRLAGRVLEGEYISPFAPIMPTGAVPLPRAPVRTESLPPAAVRRMQPNPHEPWRSSAAGVVVAHLATAHVAGGAVDGRVCACTHGEADVIVGGHMGERPVTVVSTRGERRIERRYYASEALSRAPA